MASSVLWRQFLYKDIYYSQKVLSYLEDNCAWALLLVLNSKINHKIYQLLLPNERPLDTFRCDNDRGFFFSSLLFQTLVFLTCHRLFNPRRSFSNSLILSISFCVLISISYLYHLHYVKNHINNIFSMDAVSMTKNLCNTEKILVLYEQTLICLTGHTTCFST